ncbi:hypothetical protein ACVME8_001676 [Bradyrhizobium diazoefficiens]
MIPGISESSSARGSETSAKVPLTKVLPLARIALGATARASEDYTGNKNVAHVLGARVANTISASGLCPWLLDADEADHGEDERVVEAPQTSFPCRASQGGDRDRRFVEWPLLRIYGCALLITLAAIAYAPAA